MPKDTAGFNARRERLVVDVRANGRLDAFRAIDDRGLTVANIVSNSGAGSTLWID